MNNSDVSEDCTDDLFFFFFDPDEEKELNDPPGTAPKKKEKLPFHDSGGLLHEKPSCVPQLQVGDSVIYKDDPTSSINLNPSFHNVPAPSYSLKKLKQHDNYLNDNTQMLQFININRFYGQTCHKRKRVELDENEANFRSAFYSICGKSIFPKEYVQKLHDAVCSSIGLPPISRTERRSIRTYFKNYAKHKTKIINAVKEYLNCKQDLVNKICSPSKLKSAKIVCK